MRCSRPEVALSSLRSLRHLLAALACLVLLAGCRFGGAVSYFDEDEAIAQAIGSLKQSIGTPVRVLNLAIEPDQLALRVQDPANRNNVNEWRLARVNVAWINW